ncbi:MAG: bifunctional glutamate N-acetyltransferase/amino-acid acetyltransferase ArgJ [Opitutales bacterium]
MHTSDSGILLEESAGLTDCPGFKTAGVACDVRGDNSARLDLALVSSDPPARAAAVFTRNDVCAAPVLLGRETLERDGEKIAGCVVNSGNANACTGEQGLSDAREMEACARAETGGEAPFFVASTGRIGRLLPMTQIRSGINAAAKKLHDGRDASFAAADAILTSDTRRKVATARFTHDGRCITVAGMAKGAGMIQPDMATMLAFLGADLDVPRATLQAALREATDDSFNRISIDGDCSTNDTVIFLANGRSGLSTEGEPRLLELFQKALNLVCRTLAEKIVGDGEKVTKLVELIVEGARTDADATRVARAVGNSLLVKTSWYGSDPNWGRLACAAGYARAGLREEQLDIYYDDVPALLRGAPQNENLPRWRAIVAKNHFRITLDLHQGAGRSRLLTSDLSEAYVDFNKSE